MSTKDTTLVCDFLASLPAHKCASWLNDASENLFGERNEHCDDIINEIGAGNTQALGQRIIDVVTVYCIEAAEDWQADRIASERIYLKRGQV